MLCVGDTYTSRRVGVIDDHRTFAGALARALDMEDDIEVVGTAADREGALALLDEKPELVVLDVHLGETDGIQLCRELIDIAPDLLVLILTAHADPKVAARAAGAGACAFLPKDGSLDGMLAALRGARAGYFSVDPSLLTAMFEPRERVATPPPEEVSSLLTPRERQLLLMMSKGMSSRMIARELGISPNTSRGYSKSLYRKLGVHSQLEAIAVAQAQGLLSPDQDGRRRRAGDDQDGVRR